MSNNTRFMVMHWGKKILKNAVVLLLIMGLGFTHVPGQTMGVTAGPDSEDSQASAPSVAWEQSYGTGDEWDYVGYGMDMTEDGGYIITGSARDEFNDYAYGRKEMLLVMKLDEGGNREWQKTFGVSSKDRVNCGYSIKQTTDGGYIVTGVYTPHMMSDANRPNISIPQKSMYLLKLDSSGNKQWDKFFLYDGDNPENKRFYTYGNSVEETTDGGFIVAGYWEQCLDWTSGAYYWGDRSGDSAPAGRMLVKTDSRGNIQWQVRRNYSEYYSAGNSKAKDVLQTADGTYIATGAQGHLGLVGSADDMVAMSIDATGGQGSNVGTIYYVDFFKVNGTGQIVSKQELLRDPREGLAIIGNSIVQNDNGCTVSAYGGALSKSYLFKTDLSGNVLWRKDFTMAQCNTMEKTQDDGYILGGIKTFGAFRAWLAKTDDLGNTQWEMSIGDFNMLNNTGSPYAINAVLQGQDGGYVVTGYKEILNPRTGQRAKYLLILKTEGRNFGASGRITTSDGSPVSGVTVDFTMEEGQGTAPIAVTTDSNGKWQQTGFETGVAYRATPQKTAYAFTEKDLLLQKSGDKYNFMATPFFTASGQVTWADGSAAANVTMRFKTLTGVGLVPEAVKTDAGGRWSQNDFLPGVTYVVTPEGKGLNVSPAYKTFSTASTALDFIAGTGYNVSGRVLTPDSQPVAGVIINFARKEGSGSTPSSVTTDANGRWNQQGFASGTTYQVVPQKQGFSFTENSKDFSRTNTALNFRAVAGFDAGGRITVLTPRGEFPIKGVKIEFSSINGGGNTPVSVTTDTNGEWHQNGFFTGSTYRVTPVASASAGYTIPGLPREIGLGETSYILTPSYFEINSRNISLSCQLTLGYNVSGQAIGADGQPLSGVTMTFSQVRGTGSIPQPVITDNEGRWSQSGFQDGTEYRVTPGKNNSVFTPESLDFSNISSGLDFTAGSAYSVSGQVTMDNGQPLSGAVITFTGSPGTGDSPTSVITGADGRFTQSGFSQGPVYQVKAEKRGYVLTPAVLTVNSSVSCNFSGRADWSGTWNTNWGIVTFTQNGSQVTGTYPGWNGRITATVSGDGLSGRWSESDFASDFDVKLSADGNTFAGDWTVNNGQRGSWTYFGGNRVMAIPGQH